MNELPFFEFWIDLDLRGYDECHQTQSILFILRCSINGGFEAGYKNPQALC